MPEADQNLHLHRLDRLLGFLGDEEGVSLFSYFQNRAAMMISSR
jgi:hypothetical protein